VARLAQRQVIFFFWPIDAFFLRDGLQAGEETFLKSSIAPSACA
jgi:hypothetical protein